MLLLLLLLLAATILLVAQQPLLHEGAILVRVLDGVGVVLARLLQHLLEVVRGLPYWGFASLAVGRGHEGPPVVPLFLLLPRSAPHALASIFIPLCFSLGVVKDSFDSLLAQAMVHRDVEEFLGGSRALPPQLVDQGHASGSGQKCHDNVGISNTGKGIAFSCEASNILAQGLVRLLPAMLEVPWVSWAFVHPLEVPYEDLPQIHQL